MTCSTAADDPAAGSIEAVEDVGCSIEQVFSEVGGHLGAAHGMFAELNTGLDALSRELSGAGIAGASAALRDVAVRLTGLADALPIETSLLSTIGDIAAEVSALLRQIAGHIHLITVIARSSRIEAASLEGSREEFLSFTGEASKLAAVVQASIGEIAREHEELTAAIAAALSGQQDFERRYRGRLVAVSAALTSTLQDIQQLQLRGADVARKARAGASRIGEAVGAAIVSLQSGDSVRQRLEHIGTALRKAKGAAASTNAIICGLQGAQLADTAGACASEISSLSSSLRRLSKEAMASAAHAGALVDVNSDSASSSVLAEMRQRLAEASDLIAACGHAKAAVNRSIASLETAHEKFGVAIAVLDHSVIDITLIGMNAGLKAGHLADRGRAFVVIANELQLAADRIAAAARMLGPALARIGQAAGELKLTHRQESLLAVDDLEGTIAAAVMQIEGGGGRLRELIGHLSHQSVDFEQRMTRSLAVMAELGSKFAPLTAIAGLLEKQARGIKSLSPADERAIGVLLEELFLTYTMDAERAIHVRMASGWGIKVSRSMPAKAVQPAAVEDVLLF